MKTLLLALLVSMTANTYLLYQTQSVKVVSSKKCDCCDQCDCGVCFCNAVTKKHCSDNCGCNILSNKCGSCCQSK